MTTLDLSSNAPAKLKVDALVVGVTKGADGPVLADAGDVDKALGGTLAAAVSSLAGTGAAGEVTKVPTAGRLPAGVVVAVGLGDTPTGKDARVDVEALRRGAGAATRALAGTTSVAVLLPVSDADEVAAVAEGALLGAYSYLRYRTTSKDAHKPPVEKVTVVTATAKDRAVKAAAKRAEVVASAVHVARDLVNTPPCDLPPAGFAAATTAHTKGTDLKVEVLDEKALAKAGFGGILGVGQGSTNPPRLVRVSYTHPKAKKRLALVGKGITFDSGGLSLKPAAAMDWMKADMGGAAAVVAAMIAIAQLKPAVNVTGYAPLAENMPSGTAQRPSDVLTIYGGKTVEVLNTDAEGRLVLADAIVRAGEDSPDFIVDAATLTGAQLVALGARTSAIMSNDDEFRDAVYAVSQRAGEAMWPMPLPPELRKSMDSEVADIANIGDRYGGMLVAGLFLKDFVPEGVTWAHLDIAGPAFNQGDPFGYTPKGGTGAAVRTLVRLAEDVATGVV
ncbi:MAG: leucyl aminopeptidase [Actinomycetes bacterium]